MDKVYERCCGIDVHKKVVVACLRTGRKKEVREYGTTTRELLNLTDWLLESDCQMIAMESTASYWKPLYNVFESNGLPAMVVNASHMKAVPGRKTDVKDAEWIADLLQHGLLKSSFIPDKAQRELRELVSYRRSLVGEKTRELNRLQKMLEGGNIKLSGTVSDINGKSARNILNALVKGENITPERLSSLVVGRLKASPSQLMEDLQGILSPLQRKMLSVVLIHIDELDKHIAELDDEIDNNMRSDYQSCIELVDSVTGIGPDSAKVILSVIGTDMSRFPSDAHLSSWAGLSPGNNESAGKRRSGRTTKGNKLLKTTMIQCAHSAVMVKSSYFCAQFQRISARRGKKRAYVAIAHSMLIAVYHMLKNGQVFSDLGADYYNQFNKERKINACLRKLQSLGWSPQNIATA